MKLPLRHLCALVLVSLALSACATSTPTSDINDPFEPLNRATHQVNKGADRVFFRPASQVYGTVVPRPVRTGLSNVASNLDTPRSVINDVLQGDFEDAGRNTARFLINSTIGLFGLFDPASSDFGLEENATGFGDTLAVWGVEEGPYAELLLFGPSTTRDSIGLTVDILTNPVTAFIGDGDEVATATAFPSVLNSRFELSSTIDSVLYESADSYAQLRLFYLERRRFELSGQTGADDDVFDPYENLFDEFADEF
ncbi:MAG: VacJ family lipoprotein [Pseudomonadota bacterium]